ncbi:MAG: hypothetical protein JNM31_09990 [Flavobacteriales bacterium]|nr:hypothetical protein [Flavobacteriales bacterium]
MITRYSSLLAFLASALGANAQSPFCDPNGNMAIFSNYDGGALTINVDQNIPNLHIGVVSYEFTRITITGAFAGNVAAVWYAGYNGDNDHCSIGSTLTTTITGVPMGITNIQLYPPATLASPNGYGSIICAYDCDINSNQGGCNTVDQVEHFFQTNWGGTVLFHLTQYDCWNQQSYAISNGGNCCGLPVISTNVREPEPVAGDALDAVLVGEELQVKGQGPFEVVDATGRKVWHTSSEASAFRVPMSQFTAGTYIVRSTSTGRSARFAVAR